MPKILILGAGRSSSSLIKYLTDNAAAHNLEITVADGSVELAQQKVKSTIASAVQFDLRNEPLKEKLVSSHDLVISLLPANLHYQVAATCVKYAKSLITASYVSDEIKALGKEAKDKGIVILMEMGLDPGIDHMSALRDLEEIKAEGGKLISFKSYTGGLIAPESDTNPWNYKFTWNPRNVVLAGQGTVKYLEKSEYKFIPYHQLFRRIENIEVDGYGNFDGYANRDSLKYLDLYNLQDVHTFLRGTLRREGFCKAWNVFVQLGLTDDSYKIRTENKMSYREFFFSFLPSSSKEWSQVLKEYLKDDTDDDVISKIQWLGIAGDEKIPFTEASPAEILQSLLERKWKLEKDDKDMIVMQHQYEFEINGSKKNKTSSLVVKGEDQTFTAMAKTVGLPMGIAALLILQEKITLKGVLLPVLKEIYEPVLKELEEKEGVKFVVSGRQ